MFSVGDATHGPSKYLAGAGFRQTQDYGALPEGSYGSNAVAHLFDHPSHYRLGVLRDSTV
jgi:hypothetical protein